MLCGGTCPYPKKAKRGSITNQCQRDEEGYELKFTYGGLYNNNDDDETLNGNAQMKTRENSNKEYGK